jgi:dual specificity tyrosine-phosphorylation-regulated kinase 1
VPSHPSPPLVSPHTNTQTYRAINEKYYNAKRERQKHEKRDADYTLNAGDVLGGNYRVIASMGKGSFGQVVSAEHVGTGAKVAVKVIKNREAFRRQAKTEIKLLELLNARDPHDQWCVVRYLEHFEHNGHVCLVFEQLAFNLYELLRRTHFRGVAVGLIRKFARQILTTLAYLSLPEIDIIHSDLKPENVLFRVPHRSALKVIDFGSSCQREKQQYKYIQSRFYRSPEVILELPYTQAIDMWSLGCILVELHTGMPLFSGKDEGDQIRRFVALKGNPPSHMLSASTKTGKYFDVTPHPGGEAGKGAGGGSGGGDMDVDAAGGSTPRSVAVEGEGEAAALPGWGPPDTEFYDSSDLEGEEDGEDAMEEGGSGGRSGRLRKSSRSPAGGRASASPSGGAQGGRRVRRKDSDTSVSSAGGASNASLSSKARPRTSGARSGPARPTPEALRPGPMYRLKPSIAAGPAAAAAAAAAAAGEAGAAVAGGSSEGVEAKPSTSKPEPVVYTDLRDVLGVHGGGPGGRRKEEKGHSSAVYLSFLDLLERMLEYDPAVRIKPMEALSHPFLRADIEAARDKRGSAMDAPSTASVSSATYGAATASPSLVGGVTGLAGALPAIAISTAVGGRRSTRGSFQGSVVGVGTPLVSPGAANLPNSSSAHSSPRQGAHAPTNASAGSDRTADRTL